MELVTKARVMTSCLESCKLGLEECFAKGDAASVEGVCRQGAYCGSWDFVCILGCSFSQLALARWSIRVFQLMPCFLQSLFGSRAHFGASSLHCGEIILASRSHVDGKWIRRWHDAVQPCKAEEKPVALERNKGSGSDSCCFELHRST